MAEARHPEATKQSDVLTSDTSDGRSLSPTPKPPGGGEGRGRLGPNRRDLGEPLLGKEDVDSASSSDVPILWDVLKQLDPACWKCGSQDHLPPHCAYGDYRRSTSPYQKRPATIRPGTNVVLNGRGQPALIAPFNRPGGWWVTQAEKKAAAKEAGTPLAQLQTEVGELKQELASHVYQIAKAKDDAKRARKGEGMARERWEEDTKLIYKLQGELCDLRQLEFTVMDLQNQARAHKHEKSRWAAVKAAQGDTMDQLSREVQALTVITGRLAPWHAGMTQGGAGPSSQGPTMPRHRGSRSRKANHVD